jgi:adenine-specific DNA-methyltransferase
VNEDTVEKITPNDPETRSADILGANIEQLKALFPEAETAGRIDFAVLRQLLGDAVEGREEKYGLTWHGKRRAREIALTPSTGTLRPYPEESVDWDTTQNLMIEGDNLEVLKLLQKSYAGKVKLIYIDPPYNTGKDFVYPDDYRNNIRNYLELTGQIDGAGRKLSTNTEASGRFHTDWLSMVYPRLKLARNLLRDDGVVFVSVDDEEIGQLRAVCDELFGEENFVATIVLKNKAGAGAKPRGFIPVHEYILCYSRDRASTVGISLPMTPQQAGLFNKRDEHFSVRGPYGTWALATTSMADRPNLRFPILFEGEEIWPEKQWLWSRERVREAQERDELVFNRKADGSWSVRFKRYLNDESGTENLSTPTTLWDGPYTHEGTGDIDSLFPTRVFTFPKPVRLLRKMLAMRFEPTEDTRDDIILDFFAGSGTTGHAVIAQNDADGGHRRYILVQLPEPLSPENGDQKVAVEFCDEMGRPRNLAELTKERLRRAGAKIRGDNPMFAGDTGFRVLKLDSTNIQAWEPDRENLEETLESAVDHLKADRSEQDILFELLLKLGLDLCVPIERREIAGKEVHAVGGGVLLVCLASAIAREDVDALACGIVDWQAELAPTGDATCVFRDSAFADDVAKTNLAATLDQHGLKRLRSL